jgi:hypothetical protein
MGLKYKIGINSAITVFAETASVFPPLLLDQGTLAVEIPGILD